jgi:hypothetical protein
MYTPPLLAPLSLIEDHAWPLFPAVPLIALRQTLKNSNLLFNLPSSVM